MIRCKYLLFGVEAEGDGPIHAALFGPDSGEVMAAYLNTHHTTAPGEFIRRQMWRSVIHSLEQHLKQPLAVQERIMRQVLGLPKGEPKPLGYYCPVCSMYHPSDPKKLTTCRKCGTQKCPAAGCRCRR